MSASNKSDRSSPGTKVYAAAIARDDILVPSATQEVYEVRPQSQRNAFARSLYKSYSIVSS